MHQRPRGILGEDGKPLPMLHTHSDGNCQFSPSDLITVVARAAVIAGAKDGKTVRDVPSEAVSRRFGERANESPRSRDRCL